MPSHGTPPHAHPPPLPSPGRAGTCGCSSTGSRVDRDPRNGENWLRLGVSSQHGGRRAGSSVCVYVCVTHTQEPTSLSPIVFLTCCLPNKQPTKFQRLHPNK